MEPGPQMVVGYKPIPLVGNSFIVAGTGFGATDYTVDGQTPLSPLVRLLRIPVVRLDDGTLAQVSFAGLMPGATGIYQINVTLPAAVRTGFHNATLSIGTATANFLLYFGN